MMSGLLLLNTYVVIVRTSPPQVVQAVNYVVSTAGITAMAALYIYLAYLAYNALLGEHGFKEFLTGILH